MNYLCLVYLEETALNAMPEGEFNAFSDEHVAVDEELKQSGHSIAAEALQPVHGHDRPGPGRQAVRHRRPVRRDQGTAARVLPDRS